MVDCLQLYFKCLSNCLESKTDPLPSSGPKKKKECEWYLRDKKWIYAGVMAFFFLEKFLFECIVFLPYCFIYSVRILPSSFVFAFSLFSRFLSFVLFNGITKYMELNGNATKTKHTLSQLSVESPYPPHACFLFSSWLSVSSKSVCLHTCSRRTPFSVTLPVFTRTQN